MTQCFAKPHLVTCSRKTLSDTFFLLSCVAYAESPETIVTISFYSTNTTLTITEIPNFEFGYPLFLPIQSTHIHSPHYSKHIHFLSNNLMCMYLFSAIQKVTKRNPVPWTRSVSLSLSSSLKHSLHSVLSAFFFL